MKERWLSVGEAARRAGVATSALRFYEAEGLIASTRTDGGQRRYHASMLRRVAFIRVSQQLGVSLDEIRQSLASLPNGRTPNRADWAKLSKAWKPRLDEQIRALVDLRDNLTSCIGCGCLSLRTCSLYNPNDRAAALGAGPRYLLGDDPDDLASLKDGKVEGSDPPSEELSAKPTKRFISCHTGRSPTHFGRDPSPD